MDKVVLGIVDTPEQAAQAVERLKVIGCRPEDISVLTPDRRGAHDFGFEQKTKAPEGALAGVGVGAVVGAVLGIAVGVGVLVFPGAGAFVAAGPVLAALSGAAVLALVLAFIGGLLGSGVPEIRARHYGGKVRSGSVLLAVHVARRRQMKRVRGVLRVVASSVTTTREAPVPADASLAR
jgi:hypothetical protein